MINCKKKAINKKILQLSKWIVKHKIIILKYYTINSVCVKCCGCAIYSIIFLYKKKHD